MSQKRALCIFGIVAALTCGPWAWYRWTFPYGYSHCCDSCLKFALDAYADKHGGVYPAGQATPEASLSLLFPKLAGAELLRGKTVPVEKVAKILTSGELLDEESCGWHYVEGLTQRDDRRLAIFWDKVGLGHHGQRLPHGGHTVVFLDGQRRVVSADEWPQFLEEQARLMASRDEKAIKGQPLLAATIRLPSGEIVDHFDGRWQLETRSEDGSGFGQTSGPHLSQSVLRWYWLQEGTTTYVLIFVDKGWRSKPVTVQVRNGKAEPSSVIFEMDGQ
jgi:hypothetical protein